MERLAKQHRTHAPPIQQLNQGNVPRHLDRPKPEWLDSLNSVGRRTLVSYLRYWNYLTTWDRGGPYALKARDLGDWKLVYDCARGMSRGRRPSPVQTIVDALLECEPRPEGVDLGWAYLSFVSATGRHTPNIPARELLTHMTKEQADLLDIYLLRWLSRNITRSIGTPLHELPAGRRLLSECAVQLDNYHLSVENYSRLITSAKRAKHLRDHALLICRGLDLGRKGNRLIADELKRSEWNDNKIRELQWESAKQMIEDLRHDKIGTQLCPVGCSLELIFKTPSRVRYGLWDDFLLDTYEGPLFRAWHIEGLKEIFSLEGKPIDDGWANKKVPHPFSKEVWALLASMLSGRDVLSLSKTCKRIHHIIFCSYAHLIWRSVCKDGMPEFAPVIDKLQQIGPDTFRSVRRAKLFLNSRKHIGQSATKFWCSYLDQSIPQNLLNCLPEGLLDEE